MNGDPMLCAPCRVGNHRSHTDDGCPDDNNFNSECECPVDLVFGLSRTPFDIDASLEKCLEAIRKRRAEVDRTALQNMGLPDKDRPTWMDIDHLLEIIDRMKQERRNDS